jgi:hypothetical protein
MNAVGMALAIVDLLVDERESIRVGIIMIGQINPLK